MRARPARRDGTVVGWAGRAGRVGAVHVGGKDDGNIWANIAGTRHSFTSSRRFFIVSIDFISRMTNQN